MHIGNWACAAVTVVFIVQLVAMLRDSARRDMEQSRAARWQAKYREPKVFAVYKDGKRNK